MPSNKTASPSSSLKVRIKIYLYCENRKCNQGSITGGIINKRETLMCFISLVIKISIISSIDIRLLMPVVARVCTMIQCYFSHSIRLVIIYLAKVIITVSVKEDILLQSWFLFAV